MRKLRGAFVGILAVLIVFALLFYGCVAQQRCAVPEHGWESIGEGRSSGRSELPQWAEVDSKSITNDYRWKRGRPRSTKLRE